MSIIMYSKTKCPYCAGARQAFKNKGLKYEEKDIAKNPELQTEFDLLSKKFGHKSVPIIIMDDKLIGGFAELMDYLYKD